MGLSPNPPSPRSLGVADNADEGMENSRSWALELESPEDAATVARELIDLCE